MKYVSLRLSSKTKEVILACIVYVLLFNLLLAYSLNFDFSKIIEGGDTFAPLNPFLFLKKGLYIWRDSVLGSINVPAFIETLYSLPLALLYLLFPPPIAHFIYWLALYSLMPISFFLLAYYLTRNLLISFYGGLLYSLNLYTAIIHHTPVYHMLYLHGITPILTLFFTKYLEQKKALNKYFLLYSIAYLPLLRMLNMYIFYFVIIPMYSYAIIRYYKRYRISCIRFLRRTISLAIMIITLSTPYILVLGISYIEGVTQAKVNLEYSLKALETSRIHAHLINVLRFIITYGWVERLPEVPGIQGFSASIVYNENPALIFLSFYPILLVAILIVIGVRTSHNLRTFIHLTLLLTIIVVFLAKMVNPPFGQINEFLYTSLPFFLVLFRSAWKYMQIPYILLLSIIVIIGLDILRRKLNRRAFYVMMIIILIIHFIYILPAVLIYSKLVSSTWIVDMPNDYYIIADFFNSQKEPFRILPLPLSKHFTGYVPYSWGYAGPDLLYTLLSKPMIDKYHNLALTNWSLNIVYRIEQLSHSNLEELINFAKISNVKYILVRKSVDLDHPYVRVWYPPKIYIDSLNMRSDVVKVLETENFILYKLSSYCPRIWVIDPKSLLNVSINKQYICIGNTTINLQVNKEFEKVNSFDLFIDFKLIKKNITRDDWRITNYQLLSTDIVKVGISPKGILHVLLYCNESGIRKYSSIVINLPSESIYNENKVKISYVNDSIYIVFNGLILCNKSIGIDLIPKITRVTIGETLKAEKMICKFYNITLSVNNDVILSFKDVIKMLSSDLLYKEEIIVTSLSFSAYILKFKNKIEFIKMVNPTFWIAKVVLYKPAMLVFSEAYDPFWRLTIYKGGNKVDTVTPISLQGVNGFLINETGELLIEIRYTHQSFYMISLLLSSLALSIVCVVLIFKFSM